MYFIDPDLVKNKMEDTYGVKLSLLYGKELFEYFGKPRAWDELLSWLSQWKESLPELPEINFDKNSEESFNEIKDLELKYWRKILENEKLWAEGIMKAIFRDGTTLKILLEFFNKQFERPYRKLAIILRKRLDEYYGDV
ncbi:MAG TPA: hypothetical protein EYP22_01860 [Methanosarcinales archaeon]|nr:hypothetical protein [Methanosarcinales archaeon]